MRYKTDADRERERQEFLDSFRKTIVDLDRRIELIRKKMNADKLLSKYEKKRRRRRK